MLDLSTPKIMGILNVTPDSFSDGGLYTKPDDALRQAEQMLEEGADIIDIGGESTRPGAEYVSLEEEMARVIPLVERLSKTFSCPISVDTRKPELMSAAIEAGAAMINDVTALRVPGAIETVAKYQVPVCLMHMQNDPKTMQQSPDYGEKGVVLSVVEFLQARIQACISAGISRGQIIIDPGFGFGKNLTHNFELLKNLNQLVALGYPVLVGLSRKAMFQALLHRSVHERLAGSLSTEFWALQQGISILRCHDVREAVDVMKVWMQLLATEDITL